MKVPKDVKESLKRELWEKADEIDWMGLTSTEKSRYYDEWSNDGKIAKILERFMPRSDVRVYIKDSLMKGYSRHKLSDPERPLRVLGVKNKAEVVEQYKKPLGCRLSDGRVIVWGKASTWKSLLMVLHMRTYGSDSRIPWGIVFFKAVGQYREVERRNMIADAAEKLGVVELSWLER